MNTSLKITYNTIFQILGRGATAASILAITFLLTRNFGVAEYGNFTAIISFITLFFVFSDFGLNAIYVREVGSDKVKQKQYYKNLLGLRLVLSILVAFAATAVLAFTDHSSLVKIGIIIGLGILIAQSFAISALAIFQAKIRYDRSLIADVFGAAANFIFVYLAIVNFPSILMVIFALVLGNSVRALVYIYLAKLQIGVFSFSFDLVFWRKLLIAALPLGLITVFSQFNAQIDKQIILLANYDPHLSLSGEVSAGIYGLAYKIFELGIVLPAYILNVGYPIMVRKKKEGLDSLFKFSKKLAVILLGFGVVGLVLGLIFAPWVVFVLGGESFNNSVLTIRILMIGLPLFFITPLLLWLAITLNKTKELLFIYAFAAVFNLVANLILIPSFGYNAAAVITLLTEAFILISVSAVILFSKKDFDTKK